MNCCWHDTRQWWIDIDGVTLVQRCCHCAAERDVGLVSGFVVEGDRPHGQYKPNYVRYTNNWIHPECSRACQPLTKRNAMSGVATISKSQVLHLTGLGFTTTEGLRGFLHEIKKEADPLPERKTDAKLIRKILRNQANTKRFHVLAAEQSRAQAA